MLRCKRAGRKSSVALGSPSLMLPRSLDATSLFCSPKAALKLIFYSWLCPFPFFILFPAYSHPCSPCHGMFVFYFTHPRARAILLVWHIIWHFETGETLHYSFE